MAYEGDFGVTLLSSVHESGFDMTSGHLEVPLGHFWVTSGSHGGCFRATQGALWDSPGHVGLLGGHAGVTLGI